MISLQLQLGIENIVLEQLKKVKTHANLDDGVTHTTLVCDELTGNIVR